MDLKTIIHTRLTQALGPSHLEVKDESAQHKGHKEAPSHGQSHFSIKIISMKFKGLPPVERHRLVYQALRKEMIEQGFIHALALTTLAPDEGM